MYASNIVLFAIGALTASASPLLQQRSSYTACPSGMYENLQCCKTNVVGIAALQCKAPSKEPASLDEFKSLCGAPAVSALCCTVPIAGQDVICMDPLPDMSAMSSMGGSGSSGSSGMPSMGSGSTGSTGLPSTR
ncbi:uncharacterized protein N7446_006971 [Penicillium canescens]|uniref:Hydrophobin n=1 Tax=Penicillium canescens TaxID=5083 RepID=A0AAD6IKJ6_PENCN|nr:uncharacterized protein N7446_006971 [Penicillium canescens]KAJ6049701.1 hypothetical protein N7444_006417 [Penicillium canescens]KAJ6052329.1 hypothetical protein N7460_002863 [Penicillium canescens]KAJ6062851.1 hypothetical protein N7446_006971 [Penicillium canescens]